MTSASQNQNHLDDEHQTIIGIDLGTSNSLVTIYRNNQPELIINNRGLRLTPSVVSFKSESEVLVGELARNQAVLNRDVTITHVKRHMGTDKRYDIRGRSYTPVEISGIILRKLKSDAETFLGHPISKAVITVPAYFNDNQRLATKHAGELAGLKVLKLLNEPTAAALAYGHARGGVSHLLVVDLGGGTLDITLLDYEDRIFRVKGLGGSTCLGGLDFDQELVRHIAENFETAHGVDLLKDPIAHQQLVIQSEKAKIDLSSVIETSITAPYISVTEKGPLHLNETLTREKFEQLIEPHLTSIRQLITETIKNYQIPPEWIETIILVGGATRVPAVEKMVREMFPAVAEIKKDLNPDEAVAMGAGVLAGILSEQVTDMDFYDITSHNLGVEDQKDKFALLIPAGTPYPCERTKLFSTIQDGQTEVVIHVLQNGERAGDDQLVSLGRFHLENIRPVPAGEPNIDVTFAIDPHGLLNITAIDLDTGLSEKITITDTISGDEMNTDERRGKGITIV